MAAPGGPSDGVPHHGRRLLDGDQVVPHRRRARLRPRDWRIGTKLAAVLVIPSVAFLVVASVQTGSLVNQATVLNDFAREVEVGEQVTALVHEVQQERDRSLGEVAAQQAADGRLDPAEGAETLQEHYRAVDWRMADFRTVAESIAGGDAAWRIAYTRVIELMDQLMTVRAAVPGGVVSVDTVLDSYTRAIDALLALLAEPSPGAERHELTEAVLRCVRLARVKEIGSRLRARLYAAARAGRYGPQDLVELTDLRAQQRTAIADFRGTATDAHILRYEAATADPRFVVASGLEESTVSGGAGDPAVLEPTGWWSASQDRHQLLRQVEVTVVDDAIDEAGASSSTQLRRTLLVAGAVLAVLLIALLTSVAIGRLIARSLRALRGQALQVAQLDLPMTLERLRQVDSRVPDISISPAAVRSMDEIGEVAEAFVAVHRSAVSVAVEQAVMRRNINDMFVNLARRSQVLVERQLELLDELERDESDPEQLENLFKLDYLAARMRRNDESLLVLAGTEATRRWTQPVALSAVTLAAAAETEQYARIRHDVEEDLYVVGHVVGDLVHLLAELLENATIFSPPETRVYITGHVHTPGAVLIEISDEGLGMSEEALAQANALLTEPPAADVAASERMGLVVISHLAARLRVRVQLRFADRGLIAGVWLPSSVLARVKEEPAYSTVAASASGGYPARKLRAVGAAVVRAVSGQPAVTRPPAALVSGGALRRTVGSSTNGPLLGGPAGAMLGGRVAGTSGRVPRRVLPTRAQDILASAGGEVAASGSVWWARQRGPVAPLPATPTPPLVPVTAGISGGGLPVRVPMAALPVASEPSVPVVPPYRVEPDPEAVSSTLSRFYGGVRQAETEKTTEVTLAPAGHRGEEEQQ